MATGKKIHITQMTNVLSFRCVCPKCGERFPEEVSLKLHRQETGHVDKIAEIGGRRPTVRTAVEGENNSTETDNEFPNEPTDMAGDSSTNGAEDGDEFSPDNHDKSSGDNEGSSSETDCVTIETYNGTTFETDNGTFEADKRTTRFKGNKDSALKGDRSTGTTQVGETSRDRYSTAADYKAISSATKRPYKCNDCGRAYRRKQSLRTHRRIHEGYVFKCHECGKQMLSATALKTHSKLHTGERPYLCTICNLGFLRQASLDEHSRNHRIESLVSQYQNPKEQLTESSQAVPLGEKANVNCECETCGLKLSGRQKYIEHMVIHAEKPYVCAICGEGFRVRNLLTTHYRLHLGEDEYKCCECNKLFVSRETLKAHSKTHSGLRPYACSVCSKTFTKRNHLNVHLKGHTGDFAYSCQECGKSFTTPSALKRHSWTHTGEKPYLCPTCGKSFRGHTRLKEHTWIHTGEKPFVCSVCGKAFNQKHCLKDHITIHENNPGLLCSFCGKTCKHRSALNAHVRTIHLEKSDDQATYLSNCSGYF